MKALRAQCATALVIMTQILCGHSTLLPSYEQPVIDDFSKLPLDSNGRLADNWLLYQDTPQCKVAFAEAFSREDVSGRQIAPCSINIIEVFFAGQGTFTCSAVTLTMGTSQDLISHTLPRNMFSTPNGIIKDDITSWIHGTAPAI